MGEGSGKRTSRTVLWVVLILALAAFVRFHNIGWSYSNNGIDEGIMVERAMLVSMGYELYSELPCDQAPLAFFIGAALDGDVVSLRTLQAELSMVAVAACMLAARKMRGNAAMLVAGLLLAVDFAFVRESRLFSLDGMSSSFLALALLAFIVYLKDKSRVALLSAGVLLGLSMSAKLYGALPLLAILVFLVLEARRNRSRTKALAVDGMLLTAMASVPIVAFMALLGPSEMIDGMVLNQGHRGFDIFLKLSVLAFFGLNLAYLLPLIGARAMWKSTAEERALLCVSLVVLAFMVFQPLTFLHHMVLMSPGLAILAGVWLAPLVESKKSNFKRFLWGNDAKNRGGLMRSSSPVLVVGIVVSSFLSLAGPLVQDEPSQVGYAEILEEMTEPGEWVISGDPTICAFADRPIPPSVVNVAYRQYPDITLEDIERAIADYDVRVVIVCYRLNDMEGLTDSLTAMGFAVPYLYVEDSHRAWLDLYQEGIGDVAFYVRLYS